jgi:hypothetical protein
VYTLSNHNQNVMPGLWKDLPYKITKKVKENWLDNLFFLVPLVGTYQCAPAARSAARGVRHAGCCSASRLHGSLASPLGRTSRSTRAGARDARSRRGAAAAGRPRRPTAPARCGAVPPRPGAHRILRTLTPRPRVRGARA